MRSIRSASVLGIVVLVLAVVGVTSPAPVVAQDDIRISAPHISGEVGTEIQISISTEDITGEDITSYQFRMLYDSSVLDIKNEVVTGADGGITRSGITVNANRPDTVNVVFADNSSISGSGALVKLKAEVVGEGTSPFTFDYFLYQDSNVQTVPTSTVDGAFTTNGGSAEVGSNGRVDFSGTGVGIVFSGVSGSDSVHVSKYGRRPASTEGISEENVSNYRYVIKAGSGLSFDSDTEVRFDVGTLDGVSDASNVTVYSRADAGAGAFSSLSTSHDSENDELVVTTDSFSEFVLASDTERLPVEIVRFEGQRAGEGTVTLQWETASETNNAGFVLQRTVSGETWTRLGFVEGHGTTSESVSYDFTDRDLPYEADVVRYRLKQIDTDGTSHVGPTASIQLGVPTRVSLMSPAPNPASGVATVRYAVPEARDVQLQVFDILGRKVTTLARGTRQGRFEQQIDTSSLPSGTYLIQLRTDGSVQTKRFSVVH